PDAVATTFHDHHEQAYGHTDPDAPVEFVNLRVEGFGRTAKAALPQASTQSAGQPEPASRRSVCLDADEGFRDTPVYRRGELEPGHVIDGPAVIIQRDTTTVVLAGQKATVAAGQVLRIGVGS
ncbi:MAG: hydantoinase/oxoprolinase family protein, partial [Alphaproteobacteria bacterium]